MWNRKRRSMNKLIKIIETADDLEISQIIHAVVRRYADVYPDWDVFFLSLPKEPAERREQLAQMLEALKNGQPM